MRQQPAPARPVLELKALERLLSRVLRAQHCPVRQRGNDDEHDRQQCGKRDERLRADSRHTAGRSAFNGDHDVYFSMACITAFSNSGRMSRTGV